MNEADMRVLGSHIDRDVVIQCKDGERMLVHLLSVDEGDGEIVYDLRQTNRAPEAGFADMEYGQQPAFLIRFAEVDSVEPAVD